jgi:molybdopterin-guanine dinucleotide biosynthesis protein A
MSLGNQCAILIGGLGTRLGKKARTKPKPPLNVGEAAFLEILLGEARRSDNLAILDRRLAPLACDSGAIAEGDIPDAKPHGWGSGSELP